MAIAALKIKPLQITGIDISPEMIRIGNEKLKKNNLSSVINLETGDSENIQYANETFDAMTGRN